MWIAEPLILDNFVVVEGQSDEQGAEEGSYRSAQERSAWAVGQKSELVVVAAQGRFG